MSIIVFFLFQFIQLPLYIVFFFFFFSCSLNIVSGRKGEGQYGHLRKWSHLNNSPTNFPQSKAEEKGNQKPSNEIRTDATSPTAPW